MNTLIRNSPLCPNPFTNSLSSFPFSVFLYLFIFQLVHLSTSMFYLYLCIFVSNVWGSFIKYWIHFIYFFGIKACLMCTLTTYTTMSLLFFFYQLYFHPLLFSLSLYLSFSLSLSVYFLPSSFYLSLSLNLFLSLPF